MRPWGFGRYAPSSCIALVLVGCGGSQPPIGAGSYGQNNDNR